MTTTNVEVKQDVVVPGTIIFVPSSPNGSGMFGIVAPFDSWKKQANERTVELFLSRQSDSNNPVPFFLFSENFEWQCKFSHTWVLPHCSLFTNHKAFEQYKGIFWSFTRRDGSLYYKQFLDQTEMLRELLIESENIDTPGGMHVQYRDIALALIQYKRENGIKLTL